MCVCVCVYMYICMYTCIHTQTHTYIYIYIYLLTLPSLYTIRFDILDDASFEVRNANRLRLLLTNPPFFSCKSFATYNSQHIFFSLYKIRFDILDDLPSNSKR